LIKKEATFRLNLTKKPAKKGNICLSSDKEYSGSGMDCFEIRGKIGTVRPEKAFHTAG
jgi:hypothetical protein